MNRDATLKVRVRSLSVDLGAGHGGHIFGRLQAVLPLLAALKQVADAKIELCRVVQVIGAELIGLEDRQELRVAQKHWVRAQIRRRLFRLILLNHGSRSQQIVIVLERHLDRIIQRNLSPHLVDLPAPALKAAVTGSDQVGIERRRLQETAPKSGIQASTYVANA